MNEQQIERALSQGVKRAGGMCLKFTSPGASGVPDRIVILPDGRIIFIELKAENGRLSKIQQWVIGEMKKLYADIRVVKGIEQVNEFLREVSA